MKKALITFGLAAALGCTAFGQAQQETSNNSTQPQPAKVRSVKADAKSSGKSNSSVATPVTETPLLQTGTNLEAQLQSVIDVRKSAVGDEVILKTTKAIKQNGEVIVPKGSNLIGRITEVKRKTKDSSTSRVGMIFDRVQGRNLDAPVNFSIVSMFTTQAAATAGDLFASDLGATGSGSARGSARPSSGGGGLLGGVGSTVNSTLGSTTSTLGSATQTVGSVASTATGTVRGTTGGLGNTLNGLQLSQSANGSASSSSTVSAQGKDVKIEKGTTFQMRVDGSARDQE